MAATAAGARAAQYDLTDEQRDLRDVIRRLVTERVAPRAAAIDETGEFPHDVRALFAEHDVLALPFATRHGGTGTGALMLSIAIEEVARACASSALMLAVQDLGTLPIRLAGTPEQQDRVLPAFAAGERLAAFALSEPDAGSDPGAMRTRAQRTDGGWRITGVKNWISNAGVADAYLVFAVTDPAANRSRAITAFLVPADAPGFAVASLERKMGMRGSPTGQLVLEDVLVPDEDVVGPVGRGFPIAMQTLDHSRLGIAAQALGLAAGATAYAAAYARERVTFGTPIIEHQAVGFMLADMETRTAAARALLYRAAAAADRDDRDLGTFSAMAKLFCSDTAMAVTTDAVQVLGGYGYVKDHPVERMMRDAKLTQIYEGTNQIQRMVVARALR